MGSSASCFVELLTHTGLLSSWAIALMHLGPRSVVLLPVLWCIELVACWTEWTYCRYKNSACVLCLCWLYTSSDCWWGYCIVEMVIHHWQMLSGQHCWTSSSSCMRRRCISGKPSCQTQFSWWITWYTRCLTSEQALTTHTTLTVLLACTRPIRLNLIAIHSGIDDLYRYIIPSVLSCQRLCLH